MSTAPTASPMPSTKASLTQEELMVIKNPELPGNHKLFEFGKNPDGSTRMWKVKPLPYMWEMAFRKNAMPMLAKMCAPWENIVRSLGQPVFAESPSFFQEVADAEVATDSYLELCLHVIINSQFFLCQ